jgi:hypothetical protein
MENRINNNCYHKAIYELRPSRVVPGQVGLFALVGFQAGQVVVENANWDESRLITWPEFDELDPVTKRKLIDFCYKTEEGVHAPQNINQINIGYFMNHSCDPCIRCGDNGDYIAARNIQSGEEFTIDMEALMKRTCFEFECRCGAANCRKRVRI